MSSDKNKVFQDGDVIRLVAKPEYQGDVKLDPADFAGAMERARKRAEDNAASREDSALSAYQYGVLLSTVKNIEFQCSKLRKQLEVSTIRRKPWYTKLFFWRNF